MLELARSCSASLGAGRRGLVTLAPAERTGGFRNVVGPVGHADRRRRCSRAVGLGAWLLPLAGIAWGDRRHPAGGVRGGWGRGAPLSSRCPPRSSPASRSCSSGGTRPRDSTATGPGGYVGVAIATGLYGAMGRAATVVLALAFLASARLVAGVAILPLAQRVLVGLERSPRRRRRGRGPGHRAAGGRGPADAAGLPWRGTPGAAGPAVERRRPSPPGRGREAEGRRGRGEARRTPAADLEGPSRRSDRSAAARRRPDGPRRHVFPPPTSSTPASPTTRRRCGRRSSRTPTVLAEALLSFGVEAQVVSSLRGPVITFYEIAIATGVRLNRVTALADDLAIELKAPSVRIVAPIPGPQHGRGRGART